MLSTLAALVTFGTLVLLVALSASAWPHLRGPSPVRADGPPRWLGLVIAPIFGLAALVPVWATGASAQESGFAIMSVIAAVLLVSHALYCRAAIRRAKAGEL
ncbi:hypothetical protein FHR90_001887 [Endobacter medicaginis]|uniref:Uncharacterized protein n=1 Tax=Endobacter medicaginis TaxID=1181271 RepID=A0A850P315_9PROT|nr:hypothetical protein [Endobacter medicaginis]MBB3174051.1 hypothetical protein [Endobacter medicaginis]MCX5476049.1 hypothetical protein [Endobacter medicaginis]NVN32437.1 hypothetical protein [Endobacter medicaginis]